MKGKFRSIKLDRQVFQKPNFWILIFFLIRLTGITNAPLETGHNWRQSLTNMIARNFCEQGLSFLYPVIDLAGEKTGIIGAEFPFFNFLIYLAASIFDYSHWYGRLINLIVSSLGIAFFAKTLKLFFNSRIALFSTLVLLASVWFSFSRKIMPDTFSVAIVLAGIYYGCTYLMHGKRKELVLFFIFSALGILCKIPALSLLAGFGVIFFIPEIANYRKRNIFFAGIGIAALVGGWYFYWVPHLVKTYGYQLYFPRGFTEGFFEIIPLWGKLLQRFYFTALYSWIAFTAYLAGLFLLVKYRQFKTVAVAGLIGVVFFVFILKTGVVFPLHNYYVIPFVPVMAFIAGWAISRIPPRYAPFFLLVIVAEGIVNQQHDFFIPDEDQYKLNLESITETYVKPGSLVIMNGGPSPQNMYFAHQKGWPVDNDKLNSDHFIDSLRQLGAGYLILDKYGENRSFFPYTKVYEDKHYRIYTLRESNWGQEF